METKNHVRTLCNYIAPIRYTENKKKKIECTSMKKKKVSSRVLATKWPVNRFVWISILVDECASHVDGEMDVDSF